jgi:transcriptional regulator with XRE-family HTH domain
MKMAANSALINREIGERIKGIRELSDLTVVELSKKLGISPEALETYENGRADIPVSILHEISAELGISMTELMTGEEAKLTTYSVVRKDTGIGIDRRKAYNYMSLAYNFAGRQMDPYLITIDPKPDKEPVSMNTHHGQEFHYCIEGSFVIMIDWHEITINEGDAIYFNSKYPHGMKALNGKPARELVIII